ncbi:hypothetical protein Pcinc_006301 [Petrolisthes cinctipes]|uniref:Glucuronosyltransferase n=1 Tax=Petrolisthes cinctipes TaxID=88211 RepID=A0AAE1GD56_PETCI|nr:hypothetical protein Pcinc_006301 [Petrolisthes cinctipes]
MATDLGPTPVRESTRTILPHHSLAFTTSPPTHKFETMNTLFKPSRFCIESSTLCMIRYRENAQRLSRILRHHPQKPLDQALWLVEHVADTQGASHLKFAARHLNFFQFFGLDVLGFALVVVLLLRRLLRVIRSSAVYVLEALVPRTKLKQS